MADGVETVKGIRVVVTDLDTGDSDELVLSRGEYVVTTAAPMHVAYEQRFANGTVQLTLKKGEADA